MDSVVQRQVAFAAWARDNGDQPLERVTRQLIEVLCPRHERERERRRDGSTCACGKRSVAAHGGFSCAEVLAIAARVGCGWPR